MGFLPHPKAQTRINIAGKAITKRKKEPFIFRFTGHHSDLQRGKTFASLTKKARIPKGFSTGILTGISTRAKYQIQVNFRLLPEAFHGSKTDFGYYCSCG
jgi:hypothetical protein